MKTTELESIFVLNRNFPPRILNVYKKIVTKNLFVLFVAYSDRFAVVSEWNVNIMIKKSVDGVQCQ